MSGLRLPTIALCLTLLAIVFFIASWTITSGDSTVIASLGFRYFSGGVALIGAATVSWEASLWLARRRGTGFSWARLLALSVMILASLACMDMAMLARWSFEVPWLRAAAGVVATFWLFALAFATLRWLLAWGGATLGVARVVLDESLRRKEALVVVGSLLLFVPALPFMLGDETQPLRHRIQTFLSFSLTFLGFALSGLTVFLACGTLSREIRGRQILIVDVKPLARWKYFLGKWLGVTSVSSILLLVFSVSIFAAATLYLPSLPATSKFDAQAIEREVLTARGSLRPRPEVTLEDVAERTLARWVEESPRRIQELGELAASQENRGNLSREEVFRLGEALAREELRERARSEWLSVGPLESETYIFDGLGALRRPPPSASSAKASDPDDFLQLRYDLRGAGHVPRSRVRLELAVFTHRSDADFVIGKAQSFSIPRWLIGEDGRLTLAIKNTDAQQPTVRFVARDGPELLYPAGSFSANFARVALFLWIQIAFLAMLGLSVTSFLSLPLATLFSFTLWMLASASNFIYESADVLALQNHDPGQAGDHAGDEGSDLIVRTIAWVLGGPLRQYSLHDPVGELARGRVFPGSDLITVFFWIGLVWTGGLAVVGAWIYSRRELARMES